MTFSNIQNSFYVNNLPSDVPMKAAQGALVTAAICLATGASAPVALLGGALAAMATLVEAATRPIIRSTFPKHELIPLAFQLFTTSALVLGVATAAAPWLGVAYKTSTGFLPLLAFLALNDFGSFYRKNTAMAAVL